jgi:phospholipase/lecithinase/hemolysin
MVGFQEAITNPEQYGLEKAVPKLCKKFIGISTKRFKLA